MAQEVQRVRYFTGEFLQEGDFNAEQAYHIRMRYLHNRWLHTLGIATGLEVTAGPGPLQVTVSPGLAIARVTETRIPEFLGEDVAKEIVLTAPLAVPLAGGGGAKIYVVASFAEQPAQPVTAGNTRWLERPSIRALAAGAPAPDNQVDLVLTQVTLNGAGSGIASIDLSERRASGVRGDVEATQLRLPVPGVADAAQWPRLRGGAANRLDLTGALNVTAGNVALGAGDVTLAPGRTVDGRDVSADGTKLENHVGDASLHVTNGNSHNHSGGDGAPIPWASITDVPDFMIRAYASFTAPTGSPAALGPRVLNVISVSRTPGQALGSFDLTFVTVPNAIFLVSVQASENVTWRVSASSSTTATIVVSKPDGTLVNPTRVFFVIL